MDRRPERSTLIAALLFGAAVGFSAVLPPDSPVALWLHLALLIAFTAGALRRSTGDRCPSWGMVAVFAACTTVAQVLWIRAGVVGGPQGDDGPADVVYLVGVAAGMLGIGTIVFAPLSGPRRWRSISDGLVVGGSIVFALWTFVFQPQGQGLGAAGRSEQYPRVAYVALDVVIAACLVLAARYQRGRPVVGWFAAAVTFAAVADGAVAYDLGQGWPAASPLANSVWTLAGLSFVAASLAPDGLGRERRTNLDEDTTVPRRGLVYASLVLAVATVAGQLELRGGMDRATTMILIGLGAAVVVNQLLVHQELRHLTEANASARARAEDSERRFRSIFEHAPIAMAIGSLDGRILAVNPALVELMGVPEERIVGRTLQDFVPASEWDERNRLIEQVLSGGVSQVTRPVSVPLRDGRNLRVELTVSAYRNPAGTQRLVAVVEDVTERLASRERLEYLVDHDALTGLPNRSRFTRELTERLAARDDRVAVAFVDLDRFKVINDGMGHEAGDQVLLETATRLGRAVGADGTVARFGGDEFTVLVHGDAPVTDVVDRILSAMAPPIELVEGARFHPTVSVGVSTARPDCTPEQLISEADAAMYRAKERGRNRAEYFQVTGLRDAEWTLRLTDDLHRALERDELEVHYQPVVDVRTGRTAGYEALMRWRHPERGLLTPDRFLDVAEETGLIVDIGAWVLRTACARAAAWPEAADGAAPSISVNLSARQLAEVTLVDTVRDALVTSGLPAERLWLEMTETAVMSDARMAGEALRELRGLGLHLALDDFGTGYSSLTYLKRFPFESIKIDKDFVDGLGVDQDDSAIVAAVVGLARSLGLNCVAEGVETPLQLRALGDLGCDRVQGYLFGRPEPVPTVERRTAGRVGDAGPAETLPR